MSWLSQGIDFFAGNASGQSGRLQKGINPLINQTKQLGNRFGGLADQSFDFNSGMNVNQRGLLQNAAANATAQGQMGAQRMAAQQGMGGSGLLQQATQNQAYSNMMGAGTKGLQAFQNQQRLGASYLGQQGDMLQQAGTMQSDLNTSLANAASEKAANRGELGRGLVGFAANAMGFGG